MLLEILLRVEHGPGFQQRDVDAQVGQDLDNRAAAGARTNHHHVVHFWTALDLEHVPNISPA